MFQRSLQSRKADVRSLCVNLDQATRYRSYVVRARGRGLVCKLSRRSTVFLCMPNLANF